MSGSSPVKLAYYVSEPEIKTSDESIILIHGATSSKGTWYKVAKKLVEKTGLKVYALDLRNHGDSPRTEDFDLAILVNDVNNFMKEHEISSTYLVGHSLGGIVAMFIALSEPERVKKLIVEDSSLKILSVEAGPIFRSFVKILKLAVLQVPPNSNLQTARTAVREFLESHTPKEFVTDPDRRDDSCLEIVQEKDGTYRWKANVDSLEKICDDVENDNPKINIVGKSYKGQALFLYGTRSKLNIINNKEHHIPFFPEAKFQAIEGATHLIHIEYPDEFCAAIVNFLQIS